MNRRPLFIAAAVVALAALTAWLLLEPPQKSADADLPASSGAKGAAAEGAGFAPDRPAATVELGDQDRAFVEGLRARFAGGIHRKHAQIKLIEQVIAYLMANYPDDWRTRVRGLLAALFPELAESLYRSFEKLLGFNDWLQANRAALAAMPPDERRQALWAARHEAFGSDAEEIWQGELRNEKVIAALAKADRLQGYSTDQRLAEFLSAVEQAYGEQAPLVLERSQTELMNRFLALPSVQADLSSLPRAQQHAQLRRVRTAMGMDEAALQRWDQLDQQRDAAWDRGTAYRLQRDAILALPAGPEQQQRLHALQNQMFGAEAEVIRSEEASGFFRFDAVRRIGRE